jgi:hypothetical protein
MLVGNMIVERTEHSFFGSAQRVLDTRTRRGSHSSWLFYLQIYCSRVTSRDLNLGRLVFISVIRSEE